MEKRYGKETEAMLSQPATEVFFNISEPRVAKWISDAIGEIEVERLLRNSPMLRDSFSQFTHFGYLKCQHCPKEKVWDDGKAAKFTHKLTHFTFEQV